MLADWESSVGTKALDQLNELRRDVFALPPVGMAQLFDAFDDARARVESNAAQHASRLQRRVEAEDARIRLVEQRATVQRQLREAEQHSAKLLVPSDVRSLVEILQATIPLVDSDLCPVCDQPYHGHDGNLTDHLASKLATLTESAQTLVEIEGRIVDLKARLASMDGELERVGADAESVEATNPADQHRLINALEAPIAAGRRILSALAASEAHIADMAARRAAYDQLRQLVAELRQEIGAPDEGLSISDEIRNLGILLERRLQAAEFEITRRSRERAAAESVDAKRREIETFAAELRAIDEQIERSAAELREAAKRKDAANELRKEAERVRSSVINRVFDTTLNTLWADLFCRFVPTEPFVPRFQKQTHASRSVDIRLETVLPDGKASGTPSSILSYGNTNTAALSLFIALHLAAPSHLQWLVFDDPVQSMDDIHVANFAAIVRQLAFLHSRQIVIAVHQRELFDYLSLELAPANPGESLMKVVLDRFDETTSVSFERVQPVPENTLALLSES